MSLLEARDVTVDYGPRCAVDHLCLTVGAGEVVGLLGPNGAGKTTTFRVLAGLLEPRAGGMVLLDDRPLSGPLHHRVRSGLGYLPQDSSLLEGMSSIDQVSVALNARGAPVEQAMGFLEQVGLEDRAEAVPQELSGGERRRLELARCLAVLPRVLLLDEPFAGLDPRVVSELSGLIRSLAERGLGILLTDHAVREALAVCDRVLLLDEGRVLVEGTVEEVAVHPLARSRWLGEDFHLDGLD
ncbi:MAG: ATP-binding cassette domain-containing protein [Myxococcota bacterium]|nr:ATP-binding cassette domain-containing protein [Myxococcota bacterium]